MRRWKPKWRSWRSSMRRSLPTRRSCARRWSTRRWCWTEHHSSCRDWLVKKNAGKRLSRYAGTLTCWFWTKTACCVCVDTTSACSVVYFDILDCALYVLYRTWMEDLAVFLGMFLLLRPSFHTWDLFSQTIALTWLTESGWERWDRSQALSELRV